MNAYGALDPNLATRSLSCAFLSLKHPKKALTMPTLSYMGLNPRESSSGGRQRLGAISKQGNSMVRYLLVEAAQAAARYDEELRRDHQRLKFRRGSAVAKVAIARKLAVRLYWKLRNQPSPVPPARMQGSSDRLLVGASRSSL